MADVLSVLRFSTNALFGALAIACFVQWRSRGGQAAAWLAATFGVLAAVVLSGLVVPEEGGGAVQLVRKLTIAALLLFPFFLYRFTTSLRRGSARINLLAASLTGVMIAWSLTLPSLPQGGARPSWLQWFVLGLLVQWTTLSVIVAVKLGAAGRSEPIPARRRMRLLSMGSIGLTAAVIVGGAAPDAGGILTVATQLASLVSALAFFCGFSPPRLLRLAWRVEAQEALRRATGELMTATRVDEVTSNLLPHVADTLGGRGAALLDEQGEVVGAHGDTPGLGEPGSDARADRDLETGPEQLELPLGKLLVWTSPYTPFFGREEFDLLRSLGALAQLALERVRAGERNAQLATIVESSSDAIISKDLNGVVTSWNRGAQAVYGYTAEEAIGRRLDFLAPPDRRDEVSEILERVRRGEQVNRFETVRMTKSGERVCVSLAVSQIVDAEGDIVGASVIARDITEQKEEEQARRTAEEKYRSIFENAVAGIFETDGVGRLVRANPALAMMLGFDSPEQLMREVKDVWSLAADPAEGDELKRLLEERGIVTGFEIEGRRRDGTTFAALIDVQTVLDERGRARGRQGTVVDISDRKRAEESYVLARMEAESANRAKSEFLSRMSHELRTPLNAILGFGQLLDLEDLEERQKESVQHIVKAGRHLLDLINEVLDIARIEVGKLSVSMEAVQVSSVVADALTLVRPMADGLDVKLEDAGATRHAAHVRADGQRLKQVLLNLLTNAVKYNLEGGTVTIACESLPSEQLRIKVTDTGPGIPEDKLDQLFVPFERLGAEQGPTEGTGLGLALSANLVKAMGGEIGVDTAPGRGSAFWVDLARAEGPVELLDQTTDWRPEGTSAEGPARKVLYIEDNISNLKLIQRILAHRPEIELVATAQGRLGIDMARQHRPDLIFLDLHLPDISGDEAFHRLRARPDTRDIPVVVVSADATEGHIRRLLDAGVHSYLTKPLDVKDFLETMDAALSGVAV